MKPAVSLLAGLLVACSGSIGSGEPKGALGEYREHHLAPRILERRLASGELALDKVYLHESEKFIVFHKIVKPSSKLDWPTFLDHSMLIFQGEALFAYQAKHCPSVTNASSTSRNTSYSGPSQASPTVFEHNSEEYVAFEFVAFDKSALNQGVCGTEVVR